MNTRHKRGIGSIPWFPIARVCVIAILVTGMYIHLSRLVFGIELTHERLITTTFDSVFAGVLLVVSVVLFLARRHVDLSRRRHAVLFYGTLTYMSLSVILHARTWFVPDNPDTLALFPWWYSLVFWALAAALIVAWSRLRSKS